MSATQSPRIKLVGFQAYQADIMAVRKAVFIDELGIDPQLEWDQKDTHATYAIAISDNTIIGVGRLQTDGQIGRIAILPEWRHQGTGTKIIRSLIESAIQARQETVYLSAQLAALPFYARLGFVKQGEPFIAAGIPHQGMSLALPSHAIHV